MTRGAPGTAEAFGQALRQRRQGAGMTQQRLAAGLSVKRATISQWENGSHLPSERHIEELDRLLPEADHVANVLPANASTEGLFDAAKFGRMKPGAFFYNIGRGTTVEQDALIGAMDRLAAAYLDVVDPEPLPREHPLWTTPNVFITPHTAGGHRGEEIRLVRHFLANLRRFRADETLKDRVM